MLLVQENLEYSELVEAFLKGAVMHYLHRILSKNPLKPDGLFNKHVEQRLDALAERGECAFMKYNFPNLERDKEEARNIGGQIDLFLDVFETTVQELEVLVSLSAKLKEPTIPMLLDCVENNSYVVEVSTFMEEFLMLYRTKKDF